jgi:hypothetical protein
MDERQPERRSNWTDAEAIDLETLRLILMLVKELYEASGVWPTATTLRAALRKPS